MQAFWPPPKTAPSYPAPWTPSRQLLDEAAAVTLDIRIKERRRWTAREPVPVPDTTKLNEEQFPFYVEFLIAEGDKVARKTLGVVGDICHRLMAMPCAP